MDFLLYSLDADVPKDRTLQWTFEDNFQFTYPTL